MKNAIAAKHATAKKILTCPQDMLLSYDKLKVGYFEQIDA
jgi:hypothetical protein